MGHIEITNYRVYYTTESRRNEQSITVASSQNSVMIDDLLSDVDYQFQVAAVALLYGDMRVMGQRSGVSIHLVIFLVSNWCSLFLSGLCLTVVDPGFSERDGT